MTIWPGEAFRSGSQAEEESRRPVPIRLLYLWLWYAVPVLILFVSLWWLASEVLGCGIASAMRHNPFLDVLAALVPAAERDELIRRYDAEPSVWSAALGILELRLSLT